jgi:hypothetical protein
MGLLISIAGFGDLVEIILQFAISQWVGSQCFYLAYGCVYYLHKFNCHR